MKILFILLTIIFILESVHATQPWALQKEKSAITFSATYDGVAFEGVFSDFNVTLSFDTKDLSSSYVESSVNVTSVNTQNRDRDQALSEPDWFYFKKFPLATFSSHELKHVSDNKFSATGILQIRDQQHEVALPFEWTKIDAQTTQLKSRFSLDRRTYDIGTGDWKKDKTIGFDVIVKLNLVFKLVN